MREDLFLVEDTTTLPIANSQPCRARPSTELVDITIHLLNMHTLFSREFKDKKISNLPTQQVFCSLIWCVMTGTPTPPPPAVNWKDLSLVELDSSNFKMISYCIPHDTFISLLFLFEF
jgi:hypothetical protein